MENLEKTGDIFRRWIPFTLSNLVCFTIEVINIVLVGHFEDEKALAAVSLAQMVINILLFAVMLGANTALETLASQAVGAKNYEKAGVYYYRGMAILAVMFFLILLPVIFSEQILIGSGQNEQVSKLAARYLLWISPAFLAWGFFDAKRLLLAAMDINYIPSFVTLSVIPLHLLLSLTFIRKFDSGMMGVCWSYTISQTTAIIILHLTTFNLDEKLRIVYKFPGMRKVFSGWGEYLALAGPGALMCGLDGLVFQSILMMSGWLGDNELTAMGILSNFCLIYFPLPLGLSLTISILVGNNLGENKVENAKTYCRLTFFLGLTAGILLALIIWLSREMIPRLYTEDRQIQTMASASMYLICLDAVTFFMQTVLQGVLRGMGEQCKASIIVTIVTNFISLPTSYYLGIKQGMGLDGLWLGVFVGNTIIFILYALLICTRDWNESAKSITKQMGTKQS